jgi:hypothetical protein
MVSNLFHTFKISKLNAYSYGCAWYECSHICVNLNACVRVMILVYSYFCYNSINYQRYPIILLQLEMQKGKCLAILQYRILNI